MRGNGLARLPAGRASGPRGSVLIAVLWCFVILGATVISMLHTTRLELRMVKNHGDQVQARYLAIAGIEKAKALIVQETRKMEAEGVSFDGSLLNDPQDFRRVPLGRGSFQVFRGISPGEQGTGGPEPVAFGVVDEGSRLNINTASLEEIRLLPGMTDAIAAAIVDWRDEDNDLTEGGAEAEYYATLVPSYRIRNGPFETLLELLGVRGVTPDLLLGEDANGNGILDPNEDDGPQSFPPDNADGRLDALWSALITLESSVMNVDARGKQKVNVQRASEETLAEVEGIGADLAKSIVAYRGKKAIETIANLLDVVPVVEQANPAQPASAPAAQPSFQPQDQSPQRAPIALGAIPGARGRSRGAPVQDAQPSDPAGQPAPGPGQDQNQGQNQGGGLAEGPKLISEELLKKIADSVCTDSNLERPGLIDINTAEAAVLSCLQGVGEELARAIVSRRESQGLFGNIAELLDVTGMTREKFQQICTRVTTRMGTFRIQAEGLIPSTGSRKRITAVIHPGDYDVETLYYREEP